MWIDKSPYWIKSGEVARIEELKKAIFMGHWCTKSPKGYWNESPVDVFYQEKPPDIQGHTNYFGLFYKDSDLFITNASSAFSEPITGVLADDGEVIVSRYRHDFQQRKGVMVDGGRDYLRSSYPVKKVLVTVAGSEFIFEEMKGE